MRGRLRVESKGLSEFKKWQRDLRVLKAACSGSAKERAAPVAR